MTRTIDVGDFEFDVDDNATDEEVNRRYQEILKARGGGTTTETPLPPAGAEVFGPPVSPGDQEMLDYYGTTDPTFAQKAIATTYGLARGAPRGTMSLLGLPVDLVNNAPRLANLLPGVDNVGPISDYPFLGGEMNRDVYDWSTGKLAELFGREPPPEIPSDAPWYVRGAERIGEELGAAAVPGFGALSAAARLGVTGARKLTTPIAREMVESAAVNPAKFIAKEAKAATAAGTGAAAANILIDPKSERAKVLTDLFGSTAGVAMTALGHMSLAGLAQMFQAGRGAPKYVDQVVKDLVVDKLAEAGGMQKTPGGPIDTQAMVDAIERHEPISNVVPGVTESLADVTKNPGIAALEYNRQSQSPGLYTQKRQENARAIVEAIERNSPTETPGAFRSALEEARQEQLGQATARTAAARTRFQEVSEQLAPLMTQTGRGDQIRAALQDASERANAIVSEAWRPLRESGATVDMTPLSEDYADIISRMSTAERMSSLPPEAGIPQRLTEVPEAEPSGLLGPNGEPLPPRQPEPTPQELNEVLGIRSALSDRAAEANRTGRRNDARIAEDFIRALDNYLETNIPPDLRAQYQAAREARREFGDRFERPGSATKSALSESYGRPTVASETLPPQFVPSNKGPVSNFRDMMREAGGDVRVQGAVRDQILADVQRQRLLENPQSLDRYLQQYSEVFNEFPQLRDELGNAGGIRRALDEATAAQTGVERELGTPERPGRSTTGKYLEFGDERAADAMSSVLSAKDPVAAIDELLNQVGNQPQAVEGAKRAFWDLMEKKNRSSGISTRDTEGVQPWRATQLKTFLDDPKNKAVMDRLYRDNPEHLSNVRNIVDAIQGLDTRQTAKAPGTSGTAQSVLPSAETIGSRLFAFKRGQVGAGWLVSSIGASIMRRMVGNARTQAVERMLDEALTNPEAAKTLLAENNPANRAALARWAKGWMGAEAANVMQDLESGGAGDADKGKEAPQYKTVDDPGGPNDGKRVKIIGRTPKGAYRGVLDDGSEWIFGEKTLK